MAISPRSPQIADLERSLTRNLVDLYLHAPGQSGWSSALDRLTDGVLTSGWAEDPTRPHLASEVVGALFPRWVNGELYGISRALVRAEAEKVRRAERAGGERHGLAWVVGFGDGVGARHPGRPDQTPAVPVLVRVRRAVGVARGRVADTCSRAAAQTVRQVLFELHVSAEPDATDEQLGQLLNRAQAAAGLPAVHRTSLCEHLVAVRRLLFGCVLAELDPDEERVILVRTTAPDGALENERKRALDRLVREAERTGSPEATAVVVSPPPAPRSHLVNQWWFDRPLVDGERAEWEGALQHCNPTRHLAGGPADPDTVVPTVLSPSGRELVFDRMARHLDGWHLYRRGREGWRARLSGLGGVPAGPGWPLLAAATGPAFANAHTPTDRLSALDAVLVNRPVSFPHLPAHLGLSADEVLDLFRAVRARSRRELTHG